MIRGLLEKELRQHWLAFAFIVAAFPAAQVFLDQNRFLARSFGTPLSSLYFEVVMILPLVVLVLSQSLIASEFRQKTQLFLEGLPCPRSAMLLIKYVLGLVLLLLGVSISVAWTFHRARHTDAMDAHFAAIVGGKTYAWTWFIYSVGFAHGFLGRYRIAIGAGAFLLVAWLLASGTSLSTYVPFSLLQLQFSLERHLFPGREIGWACAIALGFTAAGLALGLVRDATVAGLLAERMSGREKLALTFVGFAAMVGIGYSVETRKSEAPFFVPGSYDVRQGVARVSVSAAVEKPLPTETAAEERTARELAANLGAMAEYLRCPRLPAVFVIHRRDLAGKLENGNLTAKQGVMLRTNLLEPGATRAQFEPWIIQAALLAQSSGRGSTDENYWVLDGFPEMWSARRANEAIRAEKWKEAAAALPKDFSATTVRRWLRTRQQLGDARAKTLAWSGLEILRARHGAPAAQNFLAAMLGTPLPHDVRGWWHDMVHPMPRRFRQTTGLSLEEFVAEWRRALSDPAPPPAT